MSLINQKKIIQLLKEYNDNFGLLNESKKEILMNKFGLKEDVAKVFDEIGKKLSIWLVRDVYLRHYINKAKTLTREKVPEEVFETWAKTQLNQEPINSLTQVLSRIMDYIIRELGGNKSSLDNLTLTEIIGKADEWHRSLNIGSGKINYIEKNPIIIDFRDEDGNGYYWVDLRTKDSKEECERMGHCGRSSLGSLYSLRSYQQNGKYKVNKSHLTASIGDDGKLYQLKGPKNSKPSEKYHRYILPLFDVKNEDDEYLIQGFGTEYETQEDFKLEDLPMETLKDLYRVRPEIFKSRRLQSKMAEFGIEIEVDPLPTDFDTSIPYEDIRKYIQGDESGFDVVRNFWTKTIYLSEIILSGDYESLENYIDIHGNIYVEDILEKYVSEELKDYMRQIIMIEVPIDEKLKFNQVSLRILIEQTEAGSDISTEISKTYREVLLEPVYEDYYPRLIQTLEYYGSIINDTLHGHIKIMGDLSEIVDIDDPKIIEIYNEVYEDFEKIYMDNVLDMIVKRDLVEKPIWEKPSVSEIEINVKIFNKRLYRELNKLEEIIKKESMNEIYHQNKIIKLLKEYNSKHSDILTEAKSKLEILINKTGLKPDTAQMFDSIAGGLSTFFANKVIDSFQKLTSMPKERVAKELNPTSQLRQDLNSIMDYFINGLNRNKSSLVNLTFEQIKEKSKEWHDSLNVGDSKINYVENNPILIDFRNENGVGYYWVNLQTNNSTEECERMGHCGRSSSGSLYSLRSYRLTPDGKYKVNDSHLTASISNNGIIYQLKGPKNSKPKEEYHKFILPLFDLQDEDDDYLIKGFGSEYASQQDFKLEDLPMQTLKDLYEIRPEIFKSRELKSKMAELGIEIETEPLPTYFYFESEFEDIHYYIDNDEVIHTQKQKTNYGSSYEVNTYLSEALFDPSKIDELYEWIGEEYSLPSYKEPSLEKVLKENVYAGLRSHMIRLLKMMKSTEEQLKQLEEVEKITEWSLQISRLANLIREIDTKDLIINYIYEVYDICYRDSIADSAIGELKQSLLTTFEGYGGVDTSKYGISIEGDIGELVDIDDPEVIEIYDNVEEDNGEIYTSDVFKELVYRDIISKPYWRRPNIDEVDIDNNHFNEQLNDSLNYIERYHL
jgi:hypothetical protein